MEKHYLYVDIQFANVPDYLKNVRAKKDVPPEAHIKISQKLTFGNKYNLTLHVTYCLCNSSPLTLYFDWYYKPKHLQIWRKLIKPLALLQTRSSPQ